MRLVRASALRAAAAPLPQAPLVASPTPIEEMPRLRAAIGARPRLLVKRDDAIAFGFGGNKVRKLALVAARAKTEHATMLITCGGVQSNHARATASAAAKLGMRCAIVANGTPPDRLSGNALLDHLLGATVRYVPSRDDRAPAMDEIAHSERAAGGHPFVIPLGASTPLGALAFVLAVAELSEQLDATPDLILHASSSGGTQAGLVAGVQALEWKTRVIGISADEPAEALRETISVIAAGIAEIVPDIGPVEDARIEVDDRFIGEGYGIPSAASCEAQSLAAATEALFLEHTYTAKAMAGLIARSRQGAFDGMETIVFWHTGGLPGIFA